jgi:hypothetical protein
MTKKNLITFLLIASYTAITFFIGCIPEDSLQWSADGSKGIYSKDGALFLVDGNTGSLTQIAPRETTTNWPAISPDGSLLACGQIVKVEDFNSSFGLLPSVEVKEIKAHAETLGQKILAEGIKDGNLPSLEDYSNEQHTAWVDRYLIEKADEQLAQKIGPAIIKKIKEKELPYYQLVLASTADPNNKKIFATSSRQLWRPRFSPDAKLIAWVADNIAGKTFEAGFDLYVAAISEKNPPVFVAPAVAIGYDFRPDSCAVAYMKPEVENFDKDKSVLGSLVERTIIDPNGKLLASPAIPDDNTTPAAHICTGPTKEFAGVLYCSWMYISYARDGRHIFFSSSKMTLPSSKLDAEKQTIFCFDILTGAVSDILPQIVIDFTQGNSNLFALSQDSRKILLPGEKNTLGLYVLGGDLNLSKPLIDENESFGEGAPPKLVAQWKGPDLVSCLVLEKSHFLTNDPNTPARRKEIVILDANGNLQQILSKDWPDELLDY